jgi:hypothetical protein
MQTVQKVAALPAGRQVQGRGHRGNRSPTTIAERWSDKESPGALINARTSQMNQDSERISTDLFPLGSKNPAIQGGFFNFFNGLPGAAG